MSKNTNNHDYKTIGKIMTDMILSERITVIQILSKDWEEKITITRETKMEEIIQYLLKHNADIGKLELAYDCVKALRPEETPPMQVIKPVEGQETVSVSVEEKERLIEILEKTIDIDPYEGCSDEEIINLINEEVIQQTSKTSNSDVSSTAYWIAGIAAAIGAVVYGGYKVLAKSPTH